MLHRKVVVAAPQRNGSGTQRGGQRSLPVPGPC